MCNHMVLCKYIAHMSEQKVIELIFTAFYKYLQGLIMDQSYSKLAIRLDEIPNGFPATESGVELKLLAKLFTPEEAEIASSMSLEKQTASTIAEMNNSSESELKPHLIRMVKKGLIDIGKLEGVGMVFGLIPFIVGFYERQNAQIDKEFAELFEQYYHESFHNVMSVSPSVHRVIPVEKTIPLDIDVMPYEKASNYLNEAQSWGVLNCICRVQKRLIGQACEHSIENCLVFSSRKGAFDRVKDIRTLSQDEAFDILKQSEKEGLIHSTNNAQGDVNYICNCCSCSCGILRSMIEHGGKSSIASSDFFAVVDEELCTGCEICIDRCHFNALKILDSVCEVNISHCYGCGLCVTTCPTDAITLYTKTAEEIHPPPVNDEDWRLQRADSRKLN